MILALRDDTSHHDAGRSLYGRSRARLPTGPASWPTRQGTSPIMVLRARSGRWLLPTSWPAWPAYSDQAPPEGTGRMPALSGDHTHDVGLLHDQEVLAVDAHLGARPLAEQHPIAGFDVERVHLAALVPGSRPDRDHLALLRP